MKPLRSFPTVFLCWYKNQIRFFRKPCEKSNRLFSVWLMNHLIQTFALFNILWEWNVENLIDCVNMKKVRSNEASISMQSSSELIETHFYPVSIVKAIKRLYCNHTKVHSDKSRKNQSLVSWTNWRNKNNFA